MPRRVTIRVPDYRPDQRGQRGWQEREPRLERAVPVHLLQVERQEEEHPEQCGPDRDRDAVCSGDGAQPKHAQRDQRMGDAAFDHQEHGEQRGPTQQRAPGSGEPHEWVSVLTMP